MSSIHLIYCDISTGNYPCIHHGIAFLAGALKDHGHRVSFHHVISPEHPEQVAKRALGNSPDVVGLSLCHNQLHYAEQFVHSMRRMGTDAFLIAGGIFPTTDPENAFMHLDVDAIALGEAEYTLVALMDAIPAGREKVYQTDGFHFKMPDGKILKRDIPPMNPDLSKLSWPDYSVFDLKKIIGESAGWMSMMLTRGCPFNCDYCCNAILMDLYQDRKSFFRRPSVEQAISLIKHNLGYAEGVKGITFDDDLLNMKKDWFVSFSEVYKREIGLPYTINSRVETLTDDIVCAMKDSGCLITNIGVESGNPWVRKNLLNRYYSNEQLVEAFSKLRSAGVLTSTYNMIALPFETKDQMLDTLRINKKLRPYRGHCFYFFPYPKTKLYRICKEFNLFQEGYEKLSGYFTSTAIKLTHCKPKDARKICNKLRLYLYLSRILHNLKLGFCTPLLYCLMIPFAGLTEQIYGGDSKLKSIIRSFVYRTIPSSDGKTHGKRVETSAN